MKNLKSKLDRLFWKYEESLYNSYIYYVGTDFEKYGDKASEIEAKAKQDFINCLSKIYTSNEILERGIAFENSVNDICNGLPVEPMENAKDVADIVGKGIWQQKLCKTVGDYVLYGKADVIREDNNLGRSKFSGSVIVKKLDYANLKKAVAPYLRSEPDFQIDEQEDGKLKGIVFAGWYSWYFDIEELR